MGFRTSEKKTAGLSGIAANILIPALIELKLLQ